MASQFIINLFIALLWVLFKDEDMFYVSTFTAGFIVGMGIVFLMRRFFGGRFYIHRVFAAFKLVLIFISETFQSAVVVIKQILARKIDIEPGIFRYETILEGDYEVTTLAMLLTLTPGSVVMEVTPEGNVFYIHAMDITRTKADLERSLGKFEKAIMEVSR